LWSNQNKRFGIISGAVQYAEDSRYLELQETKLQLTPDKSNLEGKSKKVRVIGSSSIRGKGFLLIPLITGILTGRTDTFCVPKHEETKEIDARTIRHFKTTLLLNFSKIVSK